MKSALLSLQSTQKVYDTTQERLTSGLKVGKPSDDPAAYYAAATLTDQASALSNRLDNMNQAVEAINAADNGISSMDSVLSSMTAIVENALATDATDTDTRAALGKKFNDLVVQLSSLAGDSAYGGTNLLSGQDITVQMGQKYDDSTYTIEGFYVAGLTQNDADSNGEVSSLLSSNIPTNWGTAASEGAADASNYAFALNYVEDPTKIVGIQSYGVGTTTPEYEAATTNIGKITTAVTAALAVDPASTTASADIQTQIDDAMAAAQAITGTSGTFSKNTSGTYVYSGTANTGTTAVVSTLNAMEALRLSVQTTTANTAALTADQTSIASNPLNTSGVSSAVTSALAVDITASSAASTIQTQTSNALTAANAAITAANTATAGTYDGTFTFDNTSSVMAYVYSGTATTDTTAMVKTLNDMYQLQTSVTKLGTDTTALTTQNTSLTDDITGTSFDVTKTVSDSWEINWTDGDTYSTDLQDVLQQIEDVQTVLQTRSKLLSFDQSTITLRESYTEDFINTLQDGSDELTLADLNEESANLLSLETSQSLSVQAMSLANTQMQNVLRLLQ
jgi:flagellin